MQLDERRRRIEAGEWVVDLRDRTAFAAGYLAGSRDSSCPTAPARPGPARPLRHADARRGDHRAGLARLAAKLARIGIDELPVPPPARSSALADGWPLRSDRVTDFGELAAALQRGSLQLPSTPAVTTNAPAASSPDPEHIPLHELADRLDKVPDGEVWIYCASGYRASVAASILDEPGRQVVRSTTTTRPPPPPGSRTTTVRALCPRTSRATRRCSTDLDLAIPPPSRTQERFMATASPDRVDAATVRGWLDQPDAVTVLHVRTPAEFETAHIRGSYNLPLALLPEHADQLAARLDRQLVLVCRSGTRACEAQQHLAGVGVDRVHVLDGGLTAYTAAVGARDATVVRGRARWALERQVRHDAGTLVLAGLGVGLRFPAGRLLTAGIGAGLTVFRLDRHLHPGPAAGRAALQPGPTRPRTRPGARAAPPAPGPVMTTTTGRPYAPG